MLMEPLRTPDQELGLIKRIDDNIKSWEIIFDMNLIEASRTNK